MTAALLLALWMPVTMHCQLEAVVQSSILQCCCDGEAAQGPGNCADHICGSVETGFYKVDENEVITAPVLFIALAADALRAVEREPALAATIVERGVPPEIRQ